MREKESGMRVIAGSARRLLLSVPEGKDTRPTTDRIKETLFNILQFDLVDQDVLDLFAGSGALGIEALSRGAKRAVFCDSGKILLTVRIWQRKPFGDWQSPLWWGRIRFLL